MKTKMKVWSFSIQHEPANQRSDININDAIRNEQSSKKQINFFNALNLPWRIFLTVYVLLLIAGGIFLVLRLINGSDSQVAYPLDMSSKVQSGQIGNQQNKINVNFIQYENDGLVAIGHGTAFQKYEIIDTPTQAVFTQTKKSEKEFQNVIYVPLEKFFGQYDSTQLRQGTADAVKKYFKANPSKRIKQMIQQAKTRLYHPFYFLDGKQIVDNQTFVSIDQLLQIEVQYDIANRKILPVIVDQSNEKKINVDLIELHNSVNFQSNLNSEGDQNDNLSQIENEEQVQNLFIRTTGNAVWYMKGLVSKMISFLSDEQTEKLLKYQQKMAYKIDPNNEWQQTLVNDCRTIQMLKFRCNIDSVHKLNPELTLDHIKNNKNDYALNYTLKIVLQALKLQQA